MALSALILRARVLRRARGKPMATSGIRVRKPKNNALRNCSIATFEELTTKKRFEPLVYMYRRRFARPKGKPIQMLEGRRQSGHSKKDLGRAKSYRIIDWGRKKRGIFGTIETVEYDPYRNARICLVKYEDGEMRYILHALGYFVSQQIISAEDAPVYVGNAMPLSNVPIGTMVHNIEQWAGSGGKLARGSGTSAIVLSRDENYVTLKMPSSEVRLISKKSWCTIGKVGRPEANMIKIGKASASKFRGRMPHVRGSAKNACDHPHGGGEGRSPIGHKHPRTPTGKAALGLKTRRPKCPSTKYILIRRKKRSGKA